MKKIKSILAVILTIVISSAFCACSANDSTTSTNDSAPAFEATEAKESSAGEETKTDFTDYSFEFEGKRFQLPCDYSEFAKIGYTTDEDELSANTFSIGTFLKNKDGVAINVQLWNNTDTKKKFSECKIGQVEFELNKEYTFKIADGFVFNENTTAEDIINKFGEPDYESEGTDTTVVEYGSGTWQTISFTIWNNKDMKKYGRVTIENKST